MGIVLLVQPVEAFNINLVPTHVVRINLDNVIITTLTEVVTLLEDNTYELPKKSRLK